MKQQSRLNRSAMTPLWVISLFITLTEAVLGVAAMRVDGGVQIALTAFVIIFPLLVAGAFFAILWCKPYVLYPPTDFRDGADAASYVEAMQRRSFDQIKIHELVKDSITSAFDEKSTTTDKMESPRENIETELIHAAIQNVDKHTIMINTRPIAGPNGEVRVIPFDPNRTVYEFLTDIYWSLSQHVQSFTYGDEWALRNDDSGEVYDGPEKSRRDVVMRQTIQEIGLRPGMRLSAVRLRGIENRRCVGTPATNLKLRG